MKKVLSMFLVLTIVLTVVGTMGTVMVSAAVTSTTTTYSEKFPTTATAGIREGTYTFTPAKEGDTAFSKVIFAPEGVNVGGKEGDLWIGETITDPNNSSAKIKNQNALAVFMFPEMSSGKVTVKFNYDATNPKVTAWENSDVGSLVYYDEANGSVTKTAALYKDWSTKFDDFDGKYMHYTIDASGEKKLVGGNTGGDGPRKQTIEYTVDFDAETYTIKTEYSTYKYTSGPFTITNSKANAVYFGIDNNNSMYTLADNQYKVQNVTVTVEGNRKNEIDLYGYEEEYLGTEDVIDGKAPVAPKVSGQLFYGWYTDSSYATRITSWADYAGTAAYARYETQITYSEAFPALSTSAVKAGTYTPKNEGDNTFNNIILADSGVNVGAQDGLLWVSEQIKDPNGEGKIKNQNALAVFTFPDVNSGKVIVKFAYDGSNNEENRWEGTDMGSLVYYNEADGSVERAAALYKDWGNNGGNYMHYTIDGNGVKQTVGIAKGATTRTRKLNVEYTVDFDAKTYTVITKDELANENTFGPFALGENKKANAIYFGLDNNSKLSNADYKVTDISVTVEAKTGMGNNITEETDAKGEKKILAAEEAVEIASENLLKNAEIDATLGKVVIGTTEITGGTILFDADGNYDVALEDTLKIKVGTTQSFLNKTAIDADTHTITIHASGEADGQTYNKDKEVIFNLGTIFAGTAKFTINVNNVPDGVEITRK